MIDHDNPIVKLCGQGMEREQAGKREAAQQLLLTAWGQSSLPVETSDCRTQRRKISDQR
jgi:hypothetical protein